MSMPAAAGAGAGAPVRSRVSPEQLDALLSFMEEHPEFAAGKQSVYSRFSASKLWRLLAERLNAAAVGSGGARKSPDKWCRYWADFKYKARRKTPGELSPAEERLRAVVGAADERPDPPESPPEPASPPRMAAISTEELLAEAAMRSALAAEKQAEAVTQGVELLRELVCVLRVSLPAVVPQHPGLPPQQHPAAPPPPPPPPHPATTLHHDHHHQLHTHHRL